MNDNKNDIINKWNVMLEQDISDNNTVNDNKILDIPFVNVISKSISHDLIDVIPMEFDGLTISEREKIISEIKQENRDGKIDAIVEGVEFKEKTIVDHPDYKPGPSVSLMYYDFKYDMGTYSH